MSRCSSTQSNIESATGPVPNAAFGVDLQSLGLCLHTSVESTGQGVPIVILVFIRELMSLYALLMQSLTVAYITVDS